jgi:PAS domain S-box-containing protein
VLFADNHSMDNPGSRLELGWDNGTRERIGMTTAVEQAADGVVITDVNGIIQFVNAAFTAMTGYSSPEVVGQTPRILQSGQYTAAFYEAMWSTIRSGQVWDGKLINRRKDGTFYTEETRIAIIRGPKGETEGYVAIMRDVTERNNAEEPPLLLSTIAESSEDAIIACLPDGTIITWSHGAETVLGHTSSESLGKHVSFVVPPGQRSILVSINSRTLQRKCVSRRDVVALHKDGRRVHVSVMVWPICDSLGNVTAISMIARDVS